MSKYIQQVMAPCTNSLVGCVSVDDYLNNIIKKHEETRKDKEKDRINHVSYCNANTGPILMTYKAEKKIDDITDNWIKEHPPIYEFTADDDITHTVWLVDNDEIIKKLTDEFKKIDSLYIADGHHRSAAAVEVGKTLRKDKPNYDGSEEFNFFLGVLFPHSTLKILDYNRVIRDLNGFTTEDFLKRAEKNFIIDLLGSMNGYKPDKRHTFGMYLDRKWYRLIAREGSFEPDDPIGSLDVSVLQNNLLEPVLGIKNPRNDE